MPFRSKGHGDGQLTPQDAADVLHSSFGRGQSSLDDATLCAAHALVGRQTVRRAQLVTATAMHDGAMRTLAGHLGRAEPSSVCVVKRLWDETSLRVQLSDEALCKVLGREVGEACIVAKQRGRGGRGSVYPGFTVQSFQQMAHIRWAQDAGCACELVIPAKLLCSNTADSIFAGLCSTVPCLAPEALKELAQRIRALVIYQFPDGHPSNKVVMTKLLQDVTGACFLSGHCVAHLLQLVWDCGARKQLSNPLYQFTHVMGNSKNCARTRAALESLALEANSIVSIEPSQQDIAFNDFVLDFTVRRPLAARSFFKDNGGLRFDADSDAALREHLAHDCAQIQAGLTSFWGLPQVSHNCWGELLGDRCCETVDAGKQKLRVSLVRVADFSLGSLKKLAENKWRSISTCVTKVALGVLCHGVLPKAFARTLAGNAEIARLKDLVQQHVDAVGAADAEGIPHVDPNAFRVLRGKRIIGAAEFMQDQDTPFNLIAFLVASLPVDKLFATFFEAEEYARSDVRQGDHRGRVGLLESMVSEDGLLRKVHVMLAEPVVGLRSPLMDFLPRLLGSSDLTRAKSGLRTARAMQLRLSADFNHRFLGVFWADEYSQARILSETAEAKTTRLRIFMSPQEHNVCPKCEGPFLLALRDRLRALQRCPCSSKCMWSSRCGTALQMTPSLHRCTSRRTCMLLLGKVEHGQWTDERNSQSLSFVHNTSADPAHCTKRGLASLTAALLV